MAQNPTSGLFDDPEYKVLSRLNGKINDMTRDQLIEQLRSLKLDTSGLKNVLKKRLKTYHKNKLITPKVKSRPAEISYEHFLVIDFEATCEINSSNKYLHEIIEFPAVLVNVANKEIVDEFHSYVKPTLNRKLSSFCTELTGIAQNTVDAAPVFSEVLNKFEKWLEKHGLRDNKFAIVTDGPWDMSRFMYLQCRLSKLRPPKWSRKWINLRKCYCNAYNQRKVSLKTMLLGLNMTFEGRPHSGISDSRNIARVLIQMLKDGCNLFVNERMFCKSIDAANNQLNNNGKKKRFIPVSQKEALKAEDEDIEESEGEDNFEGLSDADSNDDDEDVHAISTSSVDALKESRKQKVKDEVDSCADLVYYMSLRKS